jgi:hypothetical protein
VVQNPVQLTTITKEKNCHNNVFKTLYLFSDTTNELELRLDNEMQARVDEWILISLTILGIVPLCESQAPMTNVYVVMDYNSAWNYSRMWKPTFEDYLNKEVGQSLNVSFKMTFNIDIEMPMDSRVSNGLIHFHFGTPASCACETARYNAVPMLNLRYSYPGNRQSGMVGGVVIAHTNSSITSFSDLRGAKIGIVHLADWATSLMPQDAIAAAGVELFRDAALVASGGLLSALPPASLYSMLLSGELDAAFVSSIHLLSAPSFLKVVGRIDDPSYPFPTSTPLSPSWGIFAFPAADGPLRVAVFNALLRLAAPHAAAAAGGYAGWDPFPSCSGVRTVLEAAAILAPDAARRPRCSWNIPGFSIYDMVKCPAGYYRVPQAAATARCRELGITCTAPTCLCGACKFADAVQVFAAA